MWNLCIANTCSTAHVTTSANKPAPAHSVAHLCLIITSDPQSTVVTLIQSFLIQHVHNHEHMSHSHWCCQLSIVVDLSHWEVADQKGLQLTVQSSSKPKCGWQQSICLCHLSIGFIYSIDDDIPWIWTLACSWWKGSLYHHSTSKWPQHTYIHIMPNIKGLVWSHHAQVWRHEHWCQCILYLHHHDGSQVHWWNLNWQPHIISCIQFSQTHLYEQNPWWLIFLPTFYFTHYPMPLHGRLSNHWFSTHYPLTPNSLLRMSLTVSGPKPLMSEAMQLWGQMSSLQWRWSPSGVTFIRLTCTTLRTAIHYSRKRRGSLRGRRKEMQSHLRRKGGRRPIRLTVTWALNLIPAWTIPAQMMDMHTRLLLTLWRPRRVADLIVNKYMYLKS